MVLGLLRTCGRDKEEQGRVPVGLDSLYRCACCHWEYLKDCKSEKMKNDALANKRHPLQSKLPPLRFECATSNATLSPLIRDDLFKSGSQRHFLSARNIMWSKLPFVKSENSNWTLGTQLYTITNLCSSVHSVIKTSPTLNDKLLTAFKLQVSAAEAYASNHLQYQ